MKRRLVLGGFIFILIFPIYASAESYDFYVDKDGDSEAKGSKSDPFKTISEAISEASKKGSGSRSILVNNGSYNEKITLEKSVKIFGESRGGVVIKDKAIMKDESSLQNVTFSGGLSGIIVNGNSDVEITNCEIKNFGKIGIHFFPGNGKAILTNSILHHGAGKGIYAQAGRRVEFSNNNIYSNGEEGIDIRENVTGVVNKNNIHDNGEGGIEIVLGQSEVKISENTIERNQANGITTQFYTQFPQIGKVAIGNNILNGNRKFGIDCALTFVSNPPVNYWKDSLQLTDNTLKGNGLGTINSFCKTRQVSAIIEESQEPSVSAVNDESLEENNQIIEEAEVRATETEEALIKIDLAVAEGSEELLPEENLTVAEEPGANNQSLKERYNQMDKKYQILLIAVFVATILFFAWIFIGWVREDLNSSVADETIKKELAKNPIKSGIPATPPSPAAQSQTVPAASSNSAASASQLPPTDPTAADNPDAAEAPSEETPPPEEKKTFKSDKLKVSFDYSGELKVAESGNSLNISQGETDWKMKFYDNEKKEDLETWFKNHFDEKDNANCSFTDATIKVGSYEGKSVKANLETEKCENAGNFAISSDKSQVVKIDIGQETVENVNKILTNFKFLE